MILFKIQNKILIHILDVLEILNNCNNLQYFNIIFINLFIF